MEEFEKFIPADPQYLAFLDAAFEKQCAVYQQNIEQTKEYERLQAEGKPVALIAEDGEEEEYFPSNYREFVAGEINSLWQEARTYVSEAHSAQEQAGAVFRLLREAFATSCYTGNSPLMPKFFDAMMNDVATAYEELELPPEEMADTSNLVHIGGVAPRAFLHEVTSEMCKYSDLALGALVDIENLTEYHEHTHGNTGDDVAQTPYDVVLRRYSRSHGIPLDECDIIPEDEKGDFIRQQQQFYVRELFAPFADVLPVGQCPEIAWFLGAAVEAIRLEDEDSKEQKNFLARYIKRGGVLPREAANDSANNSYAPSAHASQQATGSNLHKVRSMEEIISDPTAMRRMKEMLEDVFTDFPNMAHNPGDIVAAKDYFENMYLSSEREQAQEPSWGR